MRLLIDSHTMIWSGDDPGKLPTRAMTLMIDPSNDRRVSVATVWEIAIKFGNGKLPLSMPFRAWTDKAIADLKLTLLPLTLEHAERQVTLPFHHRDPFDRLIAAQALVEGIPLVSADPIFLAYSVTRIWD